MTPSRPMTCHHPIRQPDGSNQPCGKPCVGYSIYCADHHEQDLIAHKRMVELFPDEDTRPSEVD